MSLQLETISFITALVALQLALVLYIWGFALKTRGADKNNKTQFKFALLAMFLAWLALTVSLITRAIQTGHVPFADMYEFTASFCWGVVGASLVFQRLLKSEILGAGGAVIAFSLLAYAFTLPSGHAPLPQVLQGTVLLPVHVFCAVIAYGMFALGFVSAVLLLIKERSGPAALPTVETLDRAGYIAVLAGLPFMTLVIVLGSVWASVAWGRFWAWDPKETASLFTWLIYAGYLITRLLFKWHGSRSAWILILGFAAVLVTFFGNLFFSGLHSYAGRS
jgi:cytochrome c-type biogenesis protein CcsB